MIAFMRTAVRDVSYCAEKCVAGNDRIREWSEERFREVLAERLMECGEFRVMRRGASRTESVEGNIAEIISAYENYSSRFDAEKAMYESGLWDGADLPSCEVYSFRFLWCLHAMRWFVSR